MRTKESKKQADKKAKKITNEIIRLESVSKSYSTGAPALNGVNLHINKGEFVFIVGDSGSGKSTLIKLLLRELTPTEGKIFVNGTDVEKLKRRKVPKFRRNMGVVFQDFRLLKDRNVYENVAFAQRIIQVPTKQIRKNVPSILSIVGLAGKYKAKPKQLSGGEQQRTSIARAIAKNPKLLLCDEPTGALDTVTGREVLELLQRMSREEKKTVVMVTHNSTFAKIATKVIRVKNGQIESIENNDAPQDANEVNW